MRKNCNYQGSGSRVQGSEVKLTTALCFLHPKPYTLKPRKGFTLIELMVAASIMGVIGLTILSTFGSGFHVFERIQSFGGAQADVLLAFEEMEQDLKNTFAFAAIPFVGDTQSMAFPAVVETTEEVDGEDEHRSSVGRISYLLEDAIYFNDVKKALVRVEQNYGQASSGAGATADEGIALAYVEDFALEFYFRSEDSGEYGWQGSWSEDDEQVLSGVKIAVTYKDGERDVEIERTVVIPALQQVIGLEEDEEEIGEEEEDDDDD